MKKILITGINGFIGSHLTEHLLKAEKDSKIYGLCRWRSNRENLVNCLDGITLLNGDLLDAPSLVRVLEESGPDEIYHLASASYVLTSFNSSTNTLMTNIIGLNNLLEAIRLVNISPRMVAITSSEVYGQVELKDIPIKEDSLFKPTSPYGVSKAAQDLLINQYCISYDMRIIRIRNFSTEGPRRGEVFFLSYFAKQMAAIKLGLCKNEIHVGNLESVRTVCDVRDMVRAYHLAMLKCNEGEAYNIGGETTMMVGDYLKAMREITGINPVVIIDPELFRPADVTLQIPDTTKFTNKTNWSPTIPINRTLNDLYDYWILELEKNSWKLKTIVR